MRRTPPMTTTPSSTTATRLLTQTSMSNVSWMLVEIVRIWIMPPEPMTVRMVITANTPASTGMPSRRLRTYIVPPAKVPSASCSRYL